MFIEYKWSHPVMPRWYLILKSQHMKCPYCDTEMTVEEFSAHAEIRRYTGRPENQFQTTNWYSMSTGQWQNDELNGHCASTAASPVEVRFVAEGKQQEQRPVRSAIIK